MAEELVLDTAIRDWVLVPLSVVMVLIGVLRYFVAKLMRSPSASPSPDPKLVKEGFVAFPTLDPAAICFCSPISLDLTPRDLDPEASPLLDFPRILASTSVSRAVLRLFFFMFRCCSCLDVDARVFACSQASGN